MTSAHYKHADDDKLTRVLENEIAIVPSEDVLLSKSQIAKFVEQTAGKAGVELLKATGHEIITRFCVGHGEDPDISKAMSKLLRRLTKIILKRSDLSPRDKMEIKYDLEDSYSTHVGYVCARTNNVSDLPPKNKMTLERLRPVAVALDRFDEKLAKRAIPSTPEIAEWFLTRKEKGFSGPFDLGKNTPTLNETDGLDIEEFLQRSKKIIDGLTKESDRTYGIDGLAEIGHALIARCQITENPLHTQKLVAQFGSLLDYVQDQASMPADRQRMMHEFFMQSFTELWSAVSRGVESDTLPVATSLALEELTNRLAQFDTHLVKISAPSLPTVSNPLQLIVRPGLSAT